MCVMCLDRKVCVWFGVLLGVFFLWLSGSDGFCVNVCVRCM